MRRLVVTLGLVAFAACGGDDGIDASPDADPGAAAVTLPSLIALPYVAAGAGGASVDVTVTNTGDDDATLRWGLTGAGFTLVSAPDALAPDASGVVTIAWDGSAVEAIAGGSLTLDGTSTGVAEVWAVAGDPALDAATFAPVTNSGGVTIGDSAVVSMPTAPYPAPGRPWMDDRVHLFVPEGYDQADANDLVLHFHGHNTTIDATIPAHHYREQVYASGANVVLVVPQGPVNAASGDFGKLSDPDGTAAMLQEVLIVLYRAGVITRPVLGDVILTSHSGGYVATSQNLAGTFHVPQIQLYDSVYGFISTFRDYALAGGRLRSNYTAGGGTDANNMTLASQLTAMGAEVHDEPTTAALRSPDPLIYFAATSHEGSTRLDDAYGEQLRWGARRGRHGGRAELRVCTGTTTTFLAPADPDGTTWDPSTDGARVVVVPSVDDPQPSDTYAVADTGLLVVDGFDRVIDGSFGGLAHDFAARVGEAAGGADTVSNEAVTEDGFDLSPYRVVIWLVGDDSTDDHTFTAAERAAITAYVAGGGHVILSGSEIGYDLSTVSGGAAFLSSVAGATYAADDAGTNTVAGVSFGAAGAAYPEEYPDTFTGTQVLAYATGASAAVGIAGQGVVVGFPLETIADDDDLADVVATLLAFVD